MASDTSDDILAMLTRFGRPRVQCMNDMTWYAAMDCNTTTEGADFKMDSGFRHPTPLAALRELLRRTEAAMAHVAASREVQPPAIENKGGSFLRRLTR